MRQEAPFLFLIFVQFLGILGDTLSQRCLRVIHRNSYRRFLTSLSVSSFLLCFIILSLFQLFSPDSLRRIDKLFQTNSTSTATATATTSWTLIDICDESQNFTQLFENSSSWIDRIALEEKRKSCFAQGPLTIWRIIYACPMLLLICIFNVPLYFSYPILLRDASGIVLFIVAATMAGLLVQPFTNRFEGADDGESNGITITNLGGVRALSIILGLVGAVLCTIEKRIGLKEKLQHRREAQRRLDRAQQVEDVEERERNRRYGPGSFRSRQDQIEEEARARDRTNEREARESELEAEERGEFVEMMADEDADRMPINDEGFRRSASDAPVTFWDFVDRAALDADDDDNRPSASTSLRRGEYSAEELSYWFCCLCIDTCSCLRCRCRCCFFPCWGQFWKAVVRGSTRLVAKVRKFVLSLPPFLAVVACVSIFLGLTRYVEDHCDVNPYGLVTVDQMFLPILIVPMIFAWDFFSGTKHLVLSCCCYCGFSHQNNNNNNENENNEQNGDDEGNNHNNGNGGARRPNRAMMINDDDSNERNNSTRNNNNYNNNLVVSNSPSHQQRFPSATRGHRRVELDGVDDMEETFGQMWSHSWKELKADYCAGLFQVLISRFLIGARQLGYAFLVIWYDMRSFAEMTLVQIVLSWFAMIFCVLVIPSFINATPDEQRTVSYRWNIGSKFFGSLVLGASVFLMHSSF